MSDIGTDYSPGWGGPAHTFVNARKAYDASAGRSYGDAKASGKTLTDLLPRAIKTLARNVIGFIIDQTGSMEGWPGVMRSKMPYLDHEAKTEYLGRDTEFCFAAIGDAHNNEDYPTQVRPFAKGEETVKAMHELVMEGKGGGQLKETYEIGALYFARNVEMPNATNPILIIVGDEAPYDMVTKADAKRYAHVALQSDISTEEIFNELKRKFAVYLIKKPYDALGGNEDMPNYERMSARDKGIYAEWAALLGADHIAILEDPERVVDDIFGILAKEAARIPYFKDELKGRQTKAQVKTVLRSLDTILKLPKEKTRLAIADGRSVMHRTKTKGAGARDVDADDETEPLV